MAPRHLNSSDEWGIVTFSAKKIPAKRIWPPKGPTGPNLSQPLLFMTISLMDGHDKSRLILFSDQ
jgi:hypothetical protein